MNQEELFNKPIGNKEIQKLEAKNVIIKEAKFEELGKNKNIILSLSVKHPEKQELINLTKVQFIADKVIKTSGLWYNTDADENIQKGSALANFMNFYNIKTLLELKDLELKTSLDDNGFLVVKAY